MTLKPQRFCKICFEILYHTNIRKCNGENSKLLNIMNTKKSIKELIQISAPVAQTKESCYNEPKQIKTAEMP